MSQQESDNDDDNPDKSTATYSSIQVRYSLHWQVIVKRDNLFRKKPLYHWQVPFETVFAYIRYSEWHWLDGVRVEPTRQFESAN